MTEVYSDPADLGYGGSFELYQDTENDRMFVRRAGERVAIERRFWGHLVDVSHHEALVVEGGPTFEDTEDGKSILMHIGVENEGDGRVTYRLAKMTREWALLEKVQ